MLYNSLKHLRNKRELRLVLMNSQKGMLIQLARIVVVGSAVGLTEIWHMAVEEPKTWLLTDQILLTNYGEFTVAF